MQGAAAETNMSALDWTDTWMTREGDYPQLQTLYVPPTYDATVSLEDSSGTAVEGATVTLNATDKTTDSAGQVVYSLEDGEYSYTVTADGYEETTGSITVSGAAVSETVTLPYASPSGTTYTVKYHIDSAASAPVSVMIGHSDSDFGQAGQLTKEGAAGETVTFDVPEGPISMRAESTEGEHMMEASVSGPLAYDVVSTADGLELVEVEVTDGTGGDGSTADDGLLDRLFGASDESDGDSWWDTLWGGDSTDDTVSGSSDDSGGFLSRLFGGSSSSDSEASGGFLDNLFRGLGLR